MNEAKQVADVLLAHLEKISFMKKALEQADALGLSRYHLVGLSVLLVALSLILSVVPVFGPNRSAAGGGALSKEEFRAFKLIEREEISHDVRRFRFALQHKRQLLGLPIGQHITLRFVDEAGEEVQRSYTPVSSDDDLGIVDFVIKVYKPSEPRFPVGGKMSQHLDGLKIGESILMRGPRGELDYRGEGKFSIVKGIGKKAETKQHSVKKIGMIAGGTGITPMLQVIRAILKNPADKTEVWLVFGNQTEDDILLRKELEALPKARFHLWLMLDRPPSGWAQGSGYITEETLKQHLPAPDADTMVFNCGPPGMIKSAADKLVTLGFSESQFFNF